MVVPERCYDARSLRKLKQITSEGATAYASQGTILFLQQLVLRFGNFTATKLVQEDLYGLGRLVLAGAEYSEGKSTSDMIRQHGDLATEESRLAFGGYFFTNYYFNRRNIPLHELGRYWAFFHRYPKELALPPSFEADISSVLGVKAEDYLATAFLLFARYTNPKQMVDGFFANPVDFVLRPEYFDKLSSAFRPKADAVLKMLSMSVNDFRQILRQRKAPQSGYQCNSVFDYPMLSANGCYIPLDIGFLTAQAAYGLEAKVSVSLRRNNRKAYDMFSQSWGKIVEQHVRNLAMFHFGNDNRERIFFEEDQRSQTSSHPDFVIRDGSDLAFYEISKSGVPPMKALSLSWKTINESIEKVLFATEDGKKGKAFQLAQSIENFKNGKLQIGNIDPKHIKRIFPVLVLEHGIPQFPPISAILRNQIAKRTSLGDAAKLFEFWDIQEFELAAPLLNQGITKLLAEKHSGEFATYPFKNFIAATRPNSPRSEYMVQLFEKGCDEMKELLFNQECGATP